MNNQATLNDELDEYEEQMGEIVHVLLDDQLTAAEKLMEIEAIVFPDGEDDE
jgi:hypothetical protein